MTLSLHELLITAKNIFVSDSLAVSEFPVFTMYAEKICLPTISTTPCNTAWAFEMVGQKFSLICQNPSISYQNLVLSCAWYLLLLSCVFVVVHLIFLFRIIFMYWIINWQAQFQCKFNWELRLVCLIIRCGYICPGKMCPGDTCLINEWWWPSTYHEVPPN